MSKSDKPSTQVKRLWKQDDGGLPLRQWVRQNTDRAVVMVWIENKRMKL